MLAGFFCPAFLAVFLAVFFAALLAHNFANCVCAKDFVSKPSVPALGYLFKKFSASPGVSQSRATNCPVDDKVIYAVINLSPPKQMCVVMRSGMGTSFADLPSGEWMVIPPVRIVATQTFPCASTANESNK